jgi:hypothetical protein
MKISKLFTVNILFNAIFDVISFNFFFKNKKGHFHFNYEIGKKNGNPILLARGLSFCL